MSKKLWLASLILCALHSSAWSALSASEGRIALLIGNEAYQQIPLLRQPRQDVRLLEQALRRLNFEVITLTDVKKGPFEKALNDFGHRAQKADVAILYYAGHGAQTKTDYLLLPVDAGTAKPKKTSSRESISMRSLLKAMRGPKASIIALDTCFMNPEGNKPAAAARGLGFNDVPDGTLLAFAASPHTCAQDNGLYAAELARQLVEPGLELRQIFRHVAMAASSASGGAQKPSMYDSLSQEVYLAGSAPEQVAMERPPVVTAPSPAPRVEPDADAFAVGKVFKDCESGCPEMVVIPPGSFMMGSPEGEGYSNEKPHHSVSINYKLAVGRFEVTFEEWDACVAAGGCKNYRPARADAGWGSGRRPVIYVRWNDAQAYVKWLSVKTGKEYRLLSESEWEYAARAGTTTAFSTGTCISTTQANFNGNYDYKGCGAKTGVYRSKTLEVGSFASNAFGLYDVHGNVFEWVSDCYQESGYDGAPVDGSARASCTGQYADMRVLRGGSWYYSPDYSRAANRYGSMPSFLGDVVGFRVARRL